MEHIGMNQILSLLQCVIILLLILIYYYYNQKRIVDVDVYWRGFGGRDLIPTHRKIS
jgi:hypothetical protein